MGFQGWYRRSNWRDSDSRNVPRKNASFHMTLRVKGRKCTSSEWTSTITAREDATGATKPWQAKGRRVAARAMKVWRDS